MCVAPVSIKNPLFGKGKYLSEYGSIVSVPREYTCTDEYIDVPCGKCAECRNVYYNSILQRAIVESRSSYMYFVTLTYDNDNLPVLKLPTGEDIYFADYSDIQNLFKRFRALDILQRDFRYLCVNEYGTNYARPHFHLLLFVSKKDDDTITTPHFIRQVLFDNLGKYFAKNVGTRKHPVYKPLFTYSVRYTSKGPMSNYYVKYVEPELKYLYNTADVDTAFVKSIRYLIGYVNKSSKFDSYVENLCDFYKYDAYLYNKLRYLLTSRVRYSKGFGCGFINGHKHYLERVSVSSSSNRLVYSEFISSLPRSLEMFIKTYPAEYDRLQVYIQCDTYRLYDTLDDYLTDITIDDFYLHTLYVYYYPREFSEMYDRYYRSSRLSSPTISYFFDFSRKYSYQLSKISTTEINYSSPVVQFIREGVEQGISFGVPYLSFKCTSDKTFTTLCKYYRERCTDLADLCNMYNSARCSTWNELKDLQMRYKSDYDYRKVSKAGANNFLRSDDENLQIQKKYLNLPVVYSEERFYLRVFKK